MGTETDSGRVDAAIARLADRQHGVVARRQLLTVGLSGRAITSRLARRILVPLHRGVYAFGHRRLRIEGRWLAAALAAGDGAVLSHRDAAALHRMREPPDSHKVSVSTPAHGRKVEGVWLFARRVLEADDVTTVHRIPVTSPARTLVDVAPMLTAGQMQATLGEADRRGLLDLAKVEAALHRARGRHGQGHARLKAALDAHVNQGTTLTRSELENRFLDLVLQARLPQPQLNAPAIDFSVDALWPDHHLVVELDGWAHHKERAAATWDREKTNRLQAAGYRVLRFMHGDVAHRPDYVADQVAQALNAGS